MRATDSGGDEGYRRPRWMLHRTAVLVLAVIAVTTTVAFATTERLVERHEHELLVQEASEVTALLQQLGSSYEASITSVVAIAEVTEGDPAEFAAAIKRVEYGGGSWVLLRKTETALTPVATVGEPRFDLRTPPAAWAAGVSRAREGFAVLGIAGEGTDRVLGIASGAGAFVAYQEQPMLVAAAQSASEQADDGADGADQYDGLAMAIYVGTERTDANFLFAIGEPGDGAAEEIIDVGGTKVLLAVDSTTPLGGSLASRWPLAVLAMGIATALGLVTVIELTLRRRDDALRQVAHLATKNAALDAALAERRAAEEATEVLEAELRQAQRLEAIGHLAGGVAHDFNNLLAAILSYADLASDGLSGQRLEDLNEIRRAARRGADLTQQLLLFSRRDHDAAVLVDVDKVITDLTRLLQRTIGEDITLVTELSNEQRTVLADPRGLEQVVLNLVVNARDATEAGGTITVSTKCVELTAAEASTMAGVSPGRYLELTVRDDGTGMADEVVNHAFEPFFTTKGPGDGTGLGLATVYGIVQQHHGHIAIATQLGVGTDIAVLLPESTEGPTAVLPEPETQRRDVLTSERILVVEDEAPVRRAIRRMLERSGYEVLEASSGPEAIEEFSDTDIDLLLTDLIMPGGINGADVAEQMRVHRHDLPVVYVTGYGADILERRGVEAAEDAATLLQKPFSESALLSAVADAFASAR